jgi:G3E family GTPase
MTSNTSDKATAESAKNTATRAKITSVPTNIITGFLGVGKTSAIMHLLQSKPDNERWAILVNEFGEIGVDGSLFAGLHGEEQQVFIREVPGGCMCCAAGLPMAIALNQLLARANPDRLLIEPTGLGHPVEMLATLMADHYREVLNVEKILTLVDARKLADSRYTGHDTFNQQIAIADVVVGNKTDLYQPQDRPALEAYAKEKAGPDVTLSFTEQGRIDLALLHGATATTITTHHHHSTDTEAEDPYGAPIPESGYIKAENQGEGFHSIGWRFDPDKTFSYEKLYGFLSGLRAERMKAVFITDEGIFGYNLTSDALSEMELDECMESRIEIIAGEVDTDWEVRLLACLI